MQSSREATFDRDVALYVWVSDVTLVWDADSCWTRPTAWLIALRIFDCAAMRSDGAARWLDVGDTSFLLSCFGRSCWKAAKQDKNVGAVKVLASEHMAHGVASFQNVRLEGTAVSCCRSGNAFGRSNLAIAGLVRLSSVPVGRRFE